MYIWNLQICRFMKNVHLIIQGDVQGIGYRSWMKNECKKLGLTGWVKNREDGTVEAVVQGDADAVAEIIEKSEKGPEVAWVEKVTTEEQPTDNNLVTFTVVY